MEVDLSILIYPLILLIPTNSTLLLAAKIIHRLSVNKGTFRKKVFTKTSELPIVRPQFISSEDSPLKFQESGVSRKSHQHHDLLFCRLTWPPFLSPYGRHTHCCWGASEVRTGSRGDDWWSTGQPVAGEPERSTRDELKDPLETNFYEAGKSPSSSSCEKVRSQWAKLNTGPGISRKHYPVDLSFQHIFFSCSCNQRPWVHVKGHSKILSTQGSAHGALSQHFQACPALSLHSDVASWAWHSTAYLRNELAPLAWSILALLLRVWRPQVLTCI